MLKEANPIASELDKTMNNDPSKSGYSIIKREVLQQFQMMMMNPQMQQNPQMMQFMQMMMQGMGNMGYNNMQQTQPAYNINPIGTQPNQNIPLNKPNNIPSDLFNSNNTTPTVSIILT